MLALFSRLFFDTAATRSAVRADISFTIAT